LRRSSSRRAGCRHDQARAFVSRLGENDAWLVATAESIDADIVGADRAAFEQLGNRHLRCR
jgi:hypothetical protein